MRKEYDLRTLKVKRRGAIADPKGTISSKPARKKSGKDQHSATSHARRAAR